MNFWDIFLSIVVGMLLGASAICAIFKYLINRGKINSVLKFCEVKKRFAEITDPPKPAPVKPVNPDLYHHEPPKKES